MPIQKGASQGKPKTPASESSTATDVELEDNEPQEPSESTDTDNDKPDISAEITALRRDARYAERKRVVRTLREQGFEVTDKTLNDVLKSLKPASTADPKEKPKAKTKPEVEIDDVESEEAKILRAENQALKQKAQAAELTHRKTVIENAITRAAAGIEFASEDAAGDALIAFQNAYDFELSDDNRTVRVLGRDGEPLVNAKSYKEMTVREVFDEFLAKRPYLKKAAAKPKTPGTPQKGTGGSGTVDMNAYIRKQAFGR